MIAVVLATIAFTALGVWAEHRWRGGAATAARTGMRWALWTLVPFVIFFNFARAELTTDHLGGILFGWIALLSAAGLVWVLAKRWLGLADNSAAAAVNCTLLANTAYLGYPLLAATLGADSISDAVVYDLGIAAPALFLLAFGIGAAYGTRAGETPRDRALAFLTRNPPLYAGIAALLAPDVLAPDIMVDASRIAIGGLLPLGFFAVGAALAEEGEEGVIRFPPRLSAPVALAGSARLALMPGLFYLLALPFIDLPAAMLVVAAMPSGINALIVAHTYGLDERLTAETIFWTTAVALLGALATLVI